MSGVRPERRARAGGFTLIELVAVVAIMALLAGVVIPNFGVLGPRALREQAWRVADSLELARQRTVVTGIPHRVRLDLERHTYRVEWLVTEARAKGLPEEEPEAEAESGPEERYTDLGSTLREGEIDLRPPRSAKVDFHPLPTSVGRAGRLEDETVFAGVEAGGRLVQGGEFEVRFERDGTTEHALIRLRSDGGDEIEIEVLPLADAVRVYDVG